MEEHKRFDFKNIKKHAQKLRREMTDSEKILWEELRGRKLNGYKFLRQHPILYNGNLIRYNYFIADFYCASRKVIIELDGPVHEDNLEYDEYRDSELQKLNIKVLRIKNEELSDLNVVLQEIKSKLDSIY